MKSKVSPFILHPEHLSSGSWGYITNGQLWLLMMIKKHMRFITSGCSKITGGNWQSKAKWTNGSRLYACTSVECKCYIWAMQSTYISLVQPKESLVDIRNWIWLCLWDCMITFWVWRLLGIKLTEEKLWSMRFQARS